MHQQAPTPERPQPENPALPCVAFLLNIVRTLLAYGRQLDQTLHAKAADNRFPVLAAGFGTHDVRRILAHIQRGILRAMMLEKFLLARAAQGREILAKPPTGPAEPSEIEALDLKLPAPARSRLAPNRAPRIDPHDPLTFSIPTLKELEAQVRRHAVGRTIAEICLDLGITVSACDSEFWDRIYQALEYFGASLEQFVAVQTHRKKTFARERERRPETWDCDWQDRTRETFRQLFGQLLGQSAPTPAAPA